MADVALWMCHRLQLLEGGEHEGNMHWRWFTACYFGVLSDDNPDSLSMISHANAGCTEDADVDCVDLSDVAGTDATRLGQI